MTTAAGQDGFVVHIHRLGIILCIIIITLLQKYHFVLTLIMNEFL